MTRVSLLRLALKWGRVRILRASQLLHPLPSRSPPFPWSACYFNTRPQLFWKTSSVWRPQGPSSSSQWLRRPSCFLMVVGDAGLWMTGRGCCFHAARSVWTLMMSPATHCDFSLMSPQQGPKMRFSDFLGLCQLKRSIRQASHGFFGPRLMLLVSSGHCNTAYGLVFTFQLHADLFIQNEFSVWDVCISWSRFIALVLAT